VKEKYTVRIAQLSVQQVFFLGCQIMNDDTKKTFTKEIHMKSWKHIRFKQNVYIQQRQEDTERINLADNACEEWNYTANMEINFQV